MLHHQNRISQIAEIVKNVDQPVSIPAVQPNRRLVEDVKRSHKPRPERCRELNALCLSARERRRKTVQRQVFQSDVVQEAEPLTNFQEKLVRNPGFLFRQL